MKPTSLLLCLASVGLLVAAAPVPSLKLFEGSFKSGMWQMSPLDADGQARDPNGAAQCLMSTDKLIHTGHSTADGDCGHTIVENGADRATVTYVCKGNGYGRTSLRREGDGYIVSAQGISGRDPYEVRVQYKRVGDCN